MANFTLTDGINDQREDVKFDIQRWIVLDFNVHKYTSTTVSGGGGTVSTNEFGGVSGRVNEVSSSISFHTDQDIWLKNLDSEEERVFNFSGYKINVRPGHTVVTLEDPLSPASLERVWVKNTGYIYYCDGVYVSNPRSSANIFVSIILLVFNAIPLLGFMTGFIGVFVAQKGEVEFLNRKDKFILFMSMVWIWPYIMLILGPTHRDSLGVFFSAILAIIFIPLMLGLLVFFTRKQFSIYKKIKDFKIARGKRIDKALSMYIHENF